MIMKFEVRNLGLVGDSLIFLQIDTPSYRF